jgi:arginase
MGGRETVVVGVAGGYGAGNPDCQDGPEVLRALRFLADLEQAGNGLRWDEPIRIAEPHRGSALDAVADIAAQLAARVERHLRRGAFPLVIGGDHSCALGTWSGIKRALGAEVRLGLIWIDAHMDSHTFGSTPSGNIHGMPLACLLGHGDGRLTGIGGDGPTLRPQDICLIGVRSFESAEAALLARLGVRVYFMDEVRRRGLAAVFAEACGIVGKGTTGYGVSIDLDAFDPAEEPGVGTPVPGGLLRADLSAAIRRLHGDDRLLALEIVEYNPYRDRNFVTARAIHDLCQSLVACGADPDAAGGGRSTTS